MIFTKVLTFSPKEDRSFFHHFPPHVFSSLTPKFAAKNLAFHNKMALQSRQINKSNHFSSKLYTFPELEDTQTILQQRAWFYDHGFQNKTTLQELLESSLSGRSAKINAIAPVVTCCQGNRKDKRTKKETRLKISYISPCAVKFTLALQMCD